MKKKHHLLILCWLLIGPLMAQTTVSITDFGAEPDSRKNTVHAIAKALDYCSKKEGITIHFPKGRYDFWPSYPKDENHVTIGFRLSRLKNVTIDGNGSEFVFHGRMQIARVEYCENILLRNFSVDWDRPYISQAEIVETADNYLDVKIDSSQYPYVIEDGKIAFVGEGWRSSMTDHVLFDKERKEILPQTWDGPMGDIFRQNVEERGNGVLRFWGRPKANPPEGTVVTLAHARYLTSGIQIAHSKNTGLKDLAIYHALSHGVLGEVSENITMDNANMVANEAKGRVFSIVADASHFVNCKGVIKVENCAHTGQGDDFINVHGKNVPITKIVNERTIQVGSDGSYHMPQDEMWFLGHETMQRGETRTIKRIKPVKTGGQQRAFQISFTEALPAGTKANDLVENKTWSAGLELRNCRILKKNRARGVLVTTPKEVIIEDNYFRTAGAAILIEGDTDHWYESGANTNVVIRNNVFEDCLTSGNRDGIRWQWGDAVIAITPSHRPTSVETEPYHNNILIHDNTFKVFDAPLVRARSVRGLLFRGNEIIKTSSYLPYAWQRSAFLLDGCRDVEISGNRIDERYTTRDILIEHMKASDLEVDRGQFDVGPVSGFNTYLN